MRGSDERGQTGAFIAPRGGLVVVPHVAIRRVQIRRGDQLAQRVDISRSVGLFDCSQDLEVAPQSRRLVERIDCQPRTQVIVLRSFCGISKRSHDQGDAGPVEMEH